MPVMFYIHPWEVILWEVTLFTSLAISLYLIWKEKKREFHIPYRAKLWGEQ